MNLGFRPPSEGSYAIPYHDFGPRHRPPRLALVAGIPDENLNGTFVLSRLADFLTRAGDGRQPGQRLRERVIVVPGYASAGDPAPAPRSEVRRGPSLAERLVDSVLGVTRNAFYRVAIDQPEYGCEELPQVRLYRPDAEERASACLFGLPAVIERPVERLARSSLIRAWREHGGENFLIRAGMCGVLHPRHCETLFRAVVAFLVRTGSLEGLELEGAEDDLHYFGLAQSFTVRAEAAGIFVSRMPVGSWVWAGQHLGEVYDGFTGAQSRVVIAPIAGLVCGMRRQPVVAEGEPLARIQLPRPRDTAAR